MDKEIRVAITHDYLNQMGGAERVVEVFHRMFPDAPIYTTILDDKKLLPELQQARINTTWMQKIPGILKNFKIFFWLFPFGVNSINLKNYDLIVSSSSAYAKGVKKGKNTIHICYCHTPMRFAWDFETYMKDINVPTFVKSIAKILTIPLRIWDKSTAKNVDYFIANSSIVEKRINQIYKVPAKKIFPPVNISRFKEISTVHDDYYLVVSRLVSYKRIDLAVQACTKMNKELIVVGDGPDRKRLESLAGPTVKFLGRISDQEVEKYMKNCKAFIFPGIEDFGITPLEVNACGRPVIAFKAGGALDTVKASVNGVYFEDQTVESLSNVIGNFDNYDWESSIIREHAETFSEDRFIKELNEFISNSFLLRKNKVLSNQS